MLTGQDWFQGWLQGRVRSRTGFTMACNGGGCLEIGRFELAIPSNAGSRRGVPLPKTGQCRELVGVCRGRGAPEAGPGQGQGQGQGQGGRRGGGGGLGVLLDVGGEGESLDDGSAWERPRARERKGGRQACYRLLFLTADPGLSGDVDSLAVSCRQAGGDGRMRGCFPGRRTHGPVDRELVQPGGKCVVGGCRSPVCRPREVLEKHDDNRWRLPGGGDRGYVVGLVGWLWLAGAAWFSEGSSGRGKNWVGCRTEGRQRCSDSEAQRTKSW